MTTNSSTEPSNEPRKLIGDKHAALCDALETLCIKGNLGGRIQFTKDWPLIAPFIFGEELTGYDRDGATDRARRTVLETEAEDRRVEMLELFSTLEDKSAVKGVMQTEYVRGVIERFGREASLLVYADWIVDRFIPPPAPPPAPEPLPEVVNAAEPVAAAPPEPESIVRPTSDEEAMPAPPRDPLDDIKPIGMEDIDTSYTPPPEAANADAPKRETPPLVKKGLRLFGIKEQN